MSAPKCPRCGTSSLQHWGYMHKCHVCGTVWKAKP
jgi:uncharacterized Zn finger protein